MCRHKEFSGFVYCTAIRNYKRVDRFGIHTVSIIQGYRKKLQQRILKVNTSLCEQVFAWFRNFAPIINEMRANRHKFFLLLLSKRHNESIEGGSTRYLHPTRRPNPIQNAKSVRYKCSNVKKTVGKKKCMKYKK